MLSFLSCIQNGTVPATSLGIAECTKQAFSLDLSKFIEVQRVHTAGINSVDIEVIESRYLLSGGSDGSIFIHDLENRQGRPHYTCNVVGKISKKSKYAHAYSTECVQWYPLDTGLFTSSGMDHKLKVWDTNLLRPVETVHMHAKVYHHHMSPLCKNSSLIAVALSKPNVVLVDLRTGARSHELKSHKGKTMSVCWSPCAETLLATGGSDNRLLMWDVRSAKSFLSSFDLHNGKASGSGALATAHNGAINGLVFTADGMHLVSFGTDDRVRLWDVAKQRNTLVNYGKIYNNSLKSLSLGVFCSSNPQLIFVPSDANLVGLNMFTGEKVTMLLGHYNAVNCAAFRPFYQELYSGGNDRNILVWTPYADQTEAYEEGTKHGDNGLQGSSTLRIHSVTADAWSSDED